MTAKKKPLTSKKSALLIASEMTDAIAKEKDDRMTKIVKKKKEPITRLEDLKKNGKAYRGKKELIAFMEGKKLSAQALINAKCYDCSGWYSDEGAVDCMCKDCPLYPKMPYNKNKVKSKVVSDETIAKRMKTMKEKKE